MINLILKRSSEIPEVVGSKRIVEFSDEHLRKGMIKYARFWTPQLDSFHVETTGSTVEILSYSAELEMASIGGGKLHRS
jgi:methylglyoxal synthase